MLWVCDDCIGMNLLTSSDNCLPQTQEIQHFYAFLSSHSPNPQVSKIYPEETRDVATKPASLQALRVSLGLAAAKSIQANRFKVSTAGRPVDRNQCRADPSKRDVASSIMTKYYHYKRLLVNDYHERYNPSLACINHKLSNNHH